MITWDWWQCKLLIIIKRQQVKRKRRRLMSSSVLGPTKVLRWWWRRRRLESLGGDQQDWRAALGRGRHGTAGHNRLGRDSDHHGSRLGRRLATLRACTLRAGTLLLAPSRHRARCARAGHGSRTATTLSLSSSLALALGFLGLARPSLLHHLQHLRHLLIQLRHRIAQVFARLAWCLWNLARHLLRLFRESRAKALLRFHAFLRLHTLLTLLACRITRRFLHACTIFSFPKFSTDNLKQNLKQIKLKLCAASKCFISNGFN